MRTALIAPLFVLVLTPAAQAGNVALGQPFTLAIGESVVVGDQPLLFTLEDVPADSRCPRNVLCVWEGDAAVRIRLEIPGEEVATVELHTAVSPLGPRQAEFAGHLVKLTDVQPYPAEPVSIDPEDYRVSFVVLAVAGGVAVDTPHWSTLKSIYRSS